MHLLTFNWIWWGQHEFDNMDSVWNSALRSSLLNWKITANWTRLNRKKTRPSVQFFQLSEWENHKKLVTKDWLSPVYHWTDTATCSPCHSLETDQIIKQIGQELGEMSSKLGLVSGFRQSESVLMISHSILDQFAQLIGQFQGNL
jgi:hypothetical protein